MIKKYLTIILFLLIINIVSAYNESGDGNNFYQLSNGVFNSGLNPSIVDDESSIVVLSDGRKTPLIVDLDGNGIDEIIILDDNTIEIYQNKTLGLVDSFTLDTASGERFSNMIAFDIDGDDFIEIIIVAEEEEELHILQLNGTLTNQTRFQGTNLSILSKGGGTFGGEVVIKCESTERCMMGYTNFLDSGFSGNAQTNTYFMTSFNSTQDGINVSRETSALTSSGFSVFCQPTIRHMTAANYDNNIDSDVEFISVVLEAEASISTDESVHVIWANILSNNSVVIERTAETTTPGRFLSVTNGDEEFTCDNSNSFNTDSDMVGNFVTSPLVFDADPTTTGLEVIIAYQVDVDEFNMEMFDSTGSSIREFPLIQTGEGIIISNVFRADIFDDGNSDFCVLGWNGASSGIDDQIIATCGSLNDQSGFGALNLQTLEFRFNKVNLFNVSLGYDIHDKIAHSAEHDSTNSNDEIVSAHGILRPFVNTGILSSCWLLGDCDMDLIFEQPKQTNSPVIISADFDNIGSDDLIVLTNNNLFYLDDGITNDPINPFCGESGSISGTCSEYSVNPCLDSVWAINTSVEIKIIANDPELDNIKVNASLYDGDVNHQDESSSVISSGTEVLFQFVANKTGTYDLVVRGSDVENNLSIETATKTFTVAAAGVVINSCISTFDSGIITLSTNVSSIGTNDLLGSDSISTGVNALGSNFSLTPFLVWIMIMIGMALGIIFSDFATKSPVMAFAALLIVEILALIMGIKIGAISSDMILILGLLGVITVGIWLGTILTGARTTSA